MLTNIIDARKLPYRFKKLNAVIEATWHDNSVKDSDSSPPELGGPNYDEKEHVSFTEAVAWAQSFEAPVTLYLYDHDSGIYTVDVRHSFDYN